LVRSFRGAYFAEFAGTISGPYESVEEAASRVAPVDESGRVLVGPATRGIFCSWLGDEELVLQLDVSRPDVPATLSVNSHTWYLESIEAAQQIAAMRRSSENGGGHVDA
jgi:hypothetical protein